MGGGGQGLRTSDRWHEKSILLTWATVKKLGPGIAFRLHSIREGNEGARERREHREVPQSLPYHGTTEPSHVDSGWPRRSQA